MANRKTLVLATTHSGCIVPTSHKLNADGYFRKRIGDKVVMYHRHVWELANGTIPDGFEVDHKCKTRACCNVEHLQLLESSKHRSKDNKGRHSDKKAKAYELWMHDPSYTGTWFAAQVGVTVSAACRWIREWKQ